MTTGRGEAVFWHVFRYRMLCILRDPEGMFWNAAFPFILTILFAFILLPLGKESDIEPIPVAIVANDVWEQSPALREALSEVSSSENRLLEVRETDRETAERMLEDFSVAGIYIPDTVHGLRLLVNRSGMDQSILQSFADTYLQVSGNVSKLSEEHPRESGRIAEELSGFNADRYFAEDPYRREGNWAAVYFFTIIGMTIMYNMTFTIDQLTRVQGNLSAQGARQQASPASHITVVLSIMLAVYIVQAVTMALLVLFMDKVVGIALLRHAGPLALLLAVACFTSIALGACVTVYLPLNAETKIGLAIGVSLMLSFFAGMMSPEVRYAIVTGLPHLSRLNPVELIADSLYSVYFYGNIPALRENAAILAAIGAVATVLAALRVRRTSYASM